MHYGSVQYTLDTALVHIECSHDDGSSILSYPPFPGQQRIDYMKRKVEEYGDLLNQWTNFNHDGGDERGELTRFAAAPAFLR